MTRTRSAKGNEQRREGKIRNTRYSRQTCEMRRDLLVLSQTTRQCLAPHASEGIGSAMDSYLVGQVGELRRMGARIRAFTWNVFQNQASQLLIASKRASN